ncbi:hypothetical protein Tco_0837615 [Tanacetum coccineum]
MRDERPFSDVTAATYTFVLICILMYTIEFQKRGIPHCQLWIYESTKVHRDEDDSGMYSKHFPKQYCDKMYIDKDGSSLLSEKRDGYISIKKQSVKLDNSRLIVSDSRLQSMGRLEHEISLTIPPQGYPWWPTQLAQLVGWTMLIKYLFKYILKGTDFVMAHITRPTDESSAPSMLTKMSKTADGRC